MLYFHCKGEPTIISFHSRFGTVPFPFPQPPTSQTIITQPLFSSSVRAFQHATSLHLSSPNNSSNIPPWTTTEPPPSHSGDAFDGGSTNQLLTHNRRPSSAAREPTFGVAFGSPANSLTFIRAIQSNSSFHQAAFEITTTNPSNNSSTSRWQKVSVAVKLVWGKHSGSACFVFHSYFYWSRKVEAFLSYFLSGLCLLFGLFLLLFFFAIFICVFLCLSMCKFSHLMVVGL